MSTIPFCAACDAYIIENGPTPCLACLVRNARADERAEERDRCIALIRACAVEYIEKGWTESANTAVALATALETEDRARLKAPER